MAEDKYFNIYANKKEQATSEALLRTIISITKEKKMLYLFIHKSRRKTIRTHKDIGYVRQYKHPKLVITYK